MKTLKPVIFIFSLVVLISMIHLKSVRYPLIFDDQHNPTLFEQTISMTNARSLSMGTFGEIKSLSSSIIPQRLFNIGIHCLNSILIFFLVSMLFGKQQGAAAAIFFGLNPCVPYAVTYITQRSIEMVVMFGLLQMIFLLLSMRAEKTRDAIGYAITSLANFYLACHCKDVGFLLCAVYPIFLVFAPKHRLKFYLWPTVIAFPLIVAYLSMDTRIGYDSGANLKIVLSACGIREHDSFATQCLMFFKYMWFWINPLAPKSIDIRVPITSNGIGVILFVSFQLLALSMFVLKKTRIVGAFALLLGFLFVPELASIRISEVFVIYRSYYWAICYSVFFGFLWSLPGFKKSAPALLCCVAIFLGFHCYRETQYFRSSLFAWEHAVAIVDRSSSEFCQTQRALSNYGVELIRNKRYSESLSYLNQAIGIGGSYGAPIVNAATAELMLGNRKKAEQLYLSAISNHDPVIREAAARGLSRIANLGDK